MTTTTSKAVADKLLPAGTAVVSIGEQGSDDTDSSVWTWTVLYTIQRKMGLVVEERILCSIAR